MNWWHRAQESVSQGALTNSKHPESLIYGAYPTHVSHGHGSYLYDTNDRKYLDYICGLGTNLLGYGNDKINQKLQSMLYGGFSHSLPTKQEVITAEKLKELFVFVDRWKFLKSGSEACSAAIKIARAATGRKNIISHGYHGWSDQFVSLTKPATGVPKQYGIYAYECLEQICDKVAAVIIEPIIDDNSPERIQWLKDLRRECDNHGVLLIYDEVICGFRYRKYGVSNCYGVTPDLIIIGKAMANGLPLAAVGGKANLMDPRQWFVSSTYAGEVLSLKACEMVCQLLQSDPDYNVDNLWEKGQDFIDRFNAQPGEIKLRAYPTRGVFTGPEKDLAIFMGEMAQAGVLFCKSWFYNWGHWPEQDSTLDLCRIVKEKIVDGMELKFPLPKSPFSTKVRQQ